MKLILKDNALLLDVKIVPNASRTQFAGLLGEALKIRVAQPPEEGRANRAVEQLIADTLGIAHAHVTVIAGHSRPRKTLRITGIPLATAQSLLQAAL